MDIIEQIRQNRNKIKDIRATYKWLQDDKLIGTFQWGWKQDKEFFISADHVHAPNCVLIHISTDGQKEYSLEQCKKPREISQLNKAFKYFGTINQLRNPYVFNVIRKPTGLLKIDNTFDLAEYLPKAERITVRPEPEVINGTSCTVLEVHNVIIGGLLQSLLVWIDTDKHFHFIKLEGYRHKKTKSPYKKRNLYTRLYDITLKQTDGLWFPTSGNSQFIRRKVFSRKPGAIIRLDIGDIQINRGIDDSEFRIQFPPGCAVWDGLSRQHHVVDEKQD